MLFIPPTSPAYRTRRRFATLCPATTSRTGYRGISLQSIRGGEKFVQLIAATRWALDILAVKAVKKYL